MIKKSLAIQKGTLFRIWRQFQAEPERIFILNDFKGGSFVHRGYLEVLVGLELVEEVPVRYRYGRENASGYSHKDVKGYKLLKKRELKGGKK